MSILQMSLSGAVIILAIAVIRAATIHKLPKKAFLVFWDIAAARLLLPISFPTPFSRLSGLEKGAAQVLRINTPIISALRLIWLVGVILFFARFALCYLRCRREFKTSLPVQNDFVGKWLSEHQLRRKIDVRSFTGISTPLTYGLFHPVILMPKNTNWKNERQLRYVLFHEYVHICRFDTVNKFIVTVAVCVHWFNPLVWLLYILFNRDVELACDERVIRCFGENDRASYAHTLICMEEKRRHIAPFYNCFSKNIIEERIKSIMKFRKKSISVLVLVLLLVTMVTGFAFASGATQGKIKSGFVKVRFDDKNGQVIIDTEDPSCQKAETDTEFVYEMDGSTLHIHKNIPSELAD